MEVLCLDEGVSGLVVEGVGEGGDESARRGRGGCRGPGVGGWGGRGGCVVAEAEEGGEAGGGGGEAEGGLAENASGQARLGGLGDGGDGESGEVAVGVRDDDLSDGVGLGALGSGDRVGDLVADLDLLRRRAAWATAVRGSGTAEVLSASARSHRSSRIALCSASPATCSRSTPISARRSSRDAAGSTAEDMIRKGGRPAPDLYYSRRSWTDEQSRSSSVAGPVGGPPRGPAWGLTASLRRTNRSDPIATTKIRCCSTCHIVNSQQTRHPPECLRLTTRHQRPAVRSRRKHRRQR